MKKIIGIFTAVVSAALLLAACSGGSKDGYVIKMRLAKGDTFVNNINMDMDMSLSVMGMNQQMKMIMDIGSHFDVLDSSTAGQQLKMTYTNMKMKMDMAMKAPNVNTDSIMDEATKGIVGKSLVLTIKDKKVTDVKGMDSIGAADEASRAMMEKMFTPESLNQTFGMMFNIYPDKPVKIGDSWDADNEVEMGSMKMKVKTTYTLAGVKDGLAELTMNGTINSTGSMEQGGMEMNMDMKGSQKGRMYVKLETGYINKGNYDMNIDATMDAMGQKIPMTLKGKYSITGNQ